MALILMEFIVLWLSGHDDRFAMNDSMTSVFAGMLSQCFKLVLKRNFNHKIKYYPNWMDCCGSFCNLNLDVYLVF